MNTLGIDDDIELSFVTWETEVHLLLKMAGETKVYELQKDDALYLAQQLIEHARNV